MPLKQKEPVGYNRWETGIQNHAFLGKEVEKMRIFINVLSYLRKQLKSLDHDAPFF